MTAENKMVLLTPRLSGYATEGSAVLSAREAPLPDHARPAVPPPGPSRRVLGEGIRVHLGTLRLRRRPEPQADSMRSPLRCAALLTGRRCTQSDAWRIQPHPRSARASRDRFAARDGHSRLSLPFSSSAAARLTRLPSMTRSHRPAKQKQTPS